MSRFDYIWEVAKADRYDAIVEVEKFNPYHDSRGRFASANTATSFTYKPGQGKMYDNAIARERERQAAMTGQFGFKKIQGEHSVADDVKATNPNYGKGQEWGLNCQRCVPTYEMRRRGLDVTAKPRILNGKDAVASLWSKVFSGQTLERCEKGSGKQQVEQKMSEWGDGARAEVYVKWKGHGKTSSHVFVAEQSGGKTNYYDPQTGQTDVSSYFKSVRTGHTWISRLDNLEPIEGVIKGCCE